MKLQRVWNKTTSAAAALSRIAFLAWMMLALWMLVIITVDTERDNHPTEYIVHSVCCYAHWMVQCLLSEELPAATFPGLFISILLILFNCQILEIQTAFEKTFSGFKNMSGFETTLRYVLQHRETYIQEPAVITWNLQNNSIATL